MSRKDVIIRPVEMSDLDEIARIDEKLTGLVRKDYWQTRLEIAALRPPWMSLVAETDNRLVGFLFGWVGESEFGIAGGTGWIDLIGLDPRYRGLGIGRALVDKFAQSGRELRAVQKVATLVDLTQTDVRDFFLRLGLRHGPMVQMEKPA